MPAWAGSATYDLNSPPTGFALVGSAEWVATGGVNNSGHIKLTDATGQSCAVLFPDFDVGLVVASFEFECMIKCGDWYGNPPADGFSVNYASATDPIIALVEGGTNPGRGGRANGWAGSFQNGGDEDNLPEEGTKTGIAVGFDTWGTGTAPVGGSNGPQDVRGISVRVDGNQIAQIAMPAVLFTEPYDYANDPNTLITGPFSCGPDPANANYGDPSCNGGSPPATGTRLLWAPLKVSVSEAGILNVFWKGANIVKDYQTTFNPRPGRIIFGASTGGAMEYAGVDDIKITTTPATKVIISTVTPNPVGFRVVIIDSGPAVLDPNSVTFKLDGVDVPVIERSKSGINSTLGWYDVTQPMAAGSVHKVLVSAKDTRGETVSRELEFTVSPYVTIPAALAVTDVNTGQPGFNVRTHQTAARNQENTVARAEQQLQGMRGANVADLALFSGGVYAETAVINYNQVNSAGAVEQNGVFQENTGAPDVVIPGIPSTTEFNADFSPYTDNIAAEITTYLHFPAAGVYEIIFNSDDGFRTTADAGVKEVLGSLLVAQFDGGRGASDTAATLYVPQAGYYAFRTVWFEGGGGANLEWSGRQHVPALTARQLLNSTAADSIKAYRGRASAGPAVVSFTHPFRTSGNPYLPTVTLSAKLEDGATAVDQGSIKMFLDGAEVAATKSKSGATTTVSFKPTANLAAGTRRLKVEFAAGAQSYSAETTFDVRNVPVVPPSLALPASAVNKSDIGFLVRTVQNDTYTDLGTRENATYAAEVQIHGLLGLPEFRDDTYFTGPLSKQGWYQEIGVINYLSTGDDGFFDNGSGYPDSPVPGIPGRLRADGVTPTSDNGTDSYSQEILTVLELQAGLYAMNVNSDDGFRLTIGNPLEWWTLPLVVGEFSGGRGAGGGFGSGTTFYFEVQQAGLYPARLLWYEGGGGSSVEWSSRTVDVNTSYTSNAILVNDFFFPASIKAYQYPLASPGVPYVKLFNPGRNRASTASPGRAGKDATLTAVLVQGTGNLDPATVKLQIDGADVTPTATKTGNEVTVTYKPAGGWTPDKDTVARLTFGDRTVSWTFRVQGSFATPAFFIEAEDFDNNGAAQAAASQMPYMGGAYAGLTAVSGTDYSRGDSASSPLYRFGVNPRVSMDRTGDRNRGLGEVAVNFKLGWIGGGQWYNYTRNIPAGKYNVYAAISHGESNPNQLDAKLQKVTSGTAADLGVFNAPGTGGWGNNALVPLKDTAGGSVLALDLGGQTTLRYAPTSGDWDFMLLVPATEEPPRFVSIVRNANGTITVTWTGGGTLQAAPSVTGPWQNVTGATSPYTFTPTDAMLFGRIMK